MILFLGFIRNYKGWLKKLKAAEERTPSAKPPGVKGKEEEKKSAQTKGISQENRTKSQM